MNSAKRAKILFLSLFISFGFIYSQSLRHDIPIPKAEVHAKKLEKHGHVRIDNYYWLNERENPKVIDYLKAENAYLDSVMSPAKQLREQLFEEIKGRIKQTDMSVPYRLDDYVYYTRFEDGKDYPIYCRKATPRLVEHKAEGIRLPGWRAASEEIMIDANVLAKGHGFFAVGGQAVSFGQNILAFAADTLGRRFYTVHFKDLKDGKMFDDVIPSVNGNMAWANDNKTLFYAKQDPTTLRSYRIYRHVLGTPASQDKLVYEEKDETFSTFAWRTKSKKYIIIGSSQTLSDEYRYLDAGNPMGEFTLFLPRERNQEYNIDHFGENFYIRTNDHAKNFRLMKTSVGSTAKSSWVEVIPHRDSVLLSDFEIFRDNLVISERRGGLTQIRIMPWSGAGEHYLQFEQPAYLAAVSVNPEFNTTLVRYVYSSLTTPFSTYDYDMVKRHKFLLKREEVLGGFDPAKYTTERLHARAGDGTLVPISIVYRKGIKKDGNNPLLLSGYGSYGSSTDPTFNSMRLSLLDRGFAFALAHVRGGQEMGRYWYDDGKLFKKKNTFTDFIACAGHLIAQGYTSKDKLFASGGSAGGLLIGAVVNMRPDLFKGVIGAVPFVDVVTTMLDESIPLTTSEYDEWGNPNEKLSYEYMLSYSPYDNVEAKAYPNILVTTGLHDSQVQYFEPAKWVAKLRAVKMDSNLVLMQVNMEAGHGGASARYKRYREVALQYAFLLSLVQTAHATGSQ